ncbi:MAG: TldD/PmbA family protein [Deltaproteobacteria bacterium]|jgi:PmbA protein|nr:TldD/PmbA family protein [Deltaproteobacteria bacterium]MBW2535682.1 TldD/PmbA family protein [Deltaproteobacteria bacterium]
MSQDLLTKAKAAVAAAQKRGAHGVRASVWRSRSGEVEWRDGKLDRLRESTRMGLSVTLYVDGRYSSNSTSDLRETALDHFLDETVAATRVLAKDPHRKLADPSRYGSPHGGDLDLYDEAGAGTISGADRRRVAQALYEAARSAPGNQEIISVTTSGSDSVSESAMATSNGMEGTKRSTRFGLLADTSVRDDGARKPSGWGYAALRRRQGLPSIEAIGREATRRALEGRKAKPEKSGRYACIVENRVVSRLLSGLLGPLSGRAIQQKQSFLADKLGQLITNERLHITDDPLLPGGLASGTYDSEGMSTQRRPIFEAGVLRTFFFDTYYGSKLGKEPTTGGWSNLVIQPGERDLAALLQRMGTGILVTGFSGGNSNSATGDFSIGIRGQFVEGGKILRPVAEMNLSGNHLTFWRQLAELGSDVWIYSSNRTPSLRFDPVQFSGV